MKITFKDYFGPYYDNVANTLQMQENATAMLARVNALRDLAEMGGCTFLTNPKTGTYVSGEGHGGFRAPECTVGAENSKHRTGHAVDSYDPYREFARWCLAHQPLLEANGLCMEDPRWTPTWVHLQDVPVGSGHTVYIPNNNPPLAAAPLPWSTA